MRQDTAGRPGLLLVCHGDLPDRLLADPECYRLYGECLSACEQMTSGLSALPEKDGLSGFSRRIVSSLSSQADGPVELAYMGFRKPGIREAMYHAVSSGARSVVCVGAGGLMLPGCGASAHLPAAIRQVMVTDPGLDIYYAQPGIRPPVASSLIMASVEHALNGRGIAPRPSGDVPRIGEDTGVVVVSSHDHSAVPGSCSRQSVRLASAVKSLSDYSRARAIEADSGISRFMAGVSSCLEATGAFCGVQPGFLDFSGPDLETAACLLAGAGASTIIAAGLPLLMHRPALSRADPSAALQRLKKTCSSDIIYIRPDPATVSGEIGAILGLKVLEAARGTPIEPLAFKNSVYDK